MLKLIPKIKLIIGSSRLLLFIQTVLLVCPSLMILFIYTKLILLIDLQISILRLLKLFTTYFLTFYSSISYDETGPSYRKRKSSFSESARKRCSQVKIFNRKYAANLQEKTRAEVCDFNKVVNCNCFEIFL